jgi:hypothetical protein
MPTVVERCAGLSTLRRTRLSPRNTLRRYPRGFGRWTLIKLLGEGIPGMPGIGAQASWIASFSTQAATWHKVSTILK